MGITVCSNDIQLIKRDAGYDHFGGSVSETYNSLDGFGRRIQQHDRPQEVKTFSKYEHHESPYSATLGAGNQVLAHHHHHQQLPLEHHEYHAAPQAEYHEAPHAEYHAQPVAYHHHHTPEQTEYHTPQNHHHHHLHHYPGKLYEEIPVPEIPPRLPPKQSYATEIIRSQEVLASPFATKPGYSASQALFDDVKLPENKDRYILIPLNPANSHGEGGKSEEVGGGNGHVNYLQPQIYPLHINQELEYQNLPIPDAGIGGQEILFKDIESDVMEKEPITSTTARPKPSPTPTTTTTTTTTAPKPPPTTTPHPKMRLLAAIIKTITTLS